MVNTVRLLVIGALAGGAFVAVFSGGLAFGKDEKPSGQPKQCVAWRVIEKTAFAIRSNPDVPTGWEPFAATSTANPGNEIVWLRACRD